MNRIGLGDLAEEEMETDDGQAEGGSGNFLLLHPQSTFTYSQFYCMGVVQSSI